LWLKESFLSDEIGVEKCLYSVLLCRLPGLISFRFPFSELLKLCAEHLRGLSEPDMKDEPDLDQLKAKEKVYFLLCC
jgi:hypothetical protein